MLEASYAHVDQISRVKTYVPLLAERFARAQLWSMAKLRGQRGDTIGVIFIDTHDAGRARMAKHLLMRVADAKFEAYSAGTDPSASLAAHVVTAMNEAGMDVQESFPKPYTEDMLRAADLVVTFGEVADVTLPPGVHHEHWDYPDPRDLDLDAVRALRDQLDARVRDLAARLTAGS